MLAILSIIILIFSVIIHEVSHGLMADKLGDPTPRMQGRLTLNPLKHIDPFGSIILPIITYLTAGFAFGWAKPVIYNPYNLKNKRWGEFLVALAGPLSNVIIALIFGFAMRLIVLTAFKYIVVINIMLAIFNLVPIPPLDGSKLFLAFLPNQYGKSRMFLERYGPLLVLVLIFFLWQFISPIIPIIFKLITGVSP